MWTTKNHQTSLQCGNLVLAPSHTTSGETSVHTPQTVAERASSIGICLDKSSSNLGQAHTSQQFIFVIPYQFGEGNSNFQFRNFILQNKNIRLFFYLFCSDVLPFCLAFSLRFLPVTFSLQFFFFPHIVDGGFISSIPIQYDNVLVSILACRSSFFAWCILL